MKSLEDSLNKTITKLGIKDKLKEQYLINNWENIMGKKLANICRPKTIKNGIIFIVCPSPLWIQELTFKKMEIVKKINYKFNYKICYDIKYVPGSLSDVNNNKSNFSLDSNMDSDLDNSIEISEIERSWINYTLDKVNQEEEELKLKIKNLMEKDLKLKKRREKLGFCKCENCGRQISPEKYNKFKVCIICHNYFTKKRMESIMNLLSDVPWLQIKDLEKYYNDLTPLEYNRIKKRIKDNAVDEVYKAYFAYVSIGTEENLKWLKNSLNKYVIIASGKKPAKIDYSTWLKWVQSFNKNIYKKFL